MKPKSYESPMVYLMRMSFTDIISDSTTAPDDTEETNDKIYGAVDGGGL